MVGGKDGGNEGRKEGEKERKVGRKKGRNKRGFRSKNERQGISINTKSSRAVTIWILV